MNKSNEKKLRNLSWSSRIENYMRQTYSKVSLRILLRFREYGE